MLLTLVTLCVTKRAKNSVVMVQQLIQTGFGAA